VQQPFKRPAYLPVISFLILILFSPAAHAQLPLHPVGARVAGIGGITTVETGIWSALNNPGALGLLNHFGAGLLHEQRFLVKETAVSSLVGTFPLLGNGVGLSLSNAGFSGYGENRFGIAIGRKLAAGFALGISVSGHLLRFPEAYTNLLALTGDLGLCVRPAKDLSLGFHVFNLTFSTWNNEAHTALPVVFSLGAAYVVAASVQLFAEITKDVYEPARAKFGTEISILQRLLLRVGLISQPFEIHFGLGYAYKNCRFDVALSRHHTLGYSPQATVSMLFL
jgi:hypothetical protein